MKLIVSCCGYGGGLFVVDVDNGGQDVHVKRLYEDGATGGMSFYRGYLFNTDFGRVRVTDGNYSTVGFVDIWHRWPGSDIHDLSIYGETLYVTVTRLNAVEIWENDGEILRWKRVGAVYFSDTSADFIHLNCASATPGGLLLSMFHNEARLREDVLQPWATVAHGCVKLISYTDLHDAADPQPVLLNRDGNWEKPYLATPVTVFRGGKFIFDNLQHPHSPVEAWGKYWVTESKTRHVRSCSPDGCGKGIQGDVEYTIPRGYVRGLAITEEWIVAGGSCSGNHPSAIAQYKDMPGTLFMKNRASGHEVSIALPGSTEVFDILCP